MIPTAQATEPSGMTPNSKIYTIKETAEWETTSSMGGHTWLLLIWQKIDIKYIKRAQN